MQKFNNREETDQEIMQL